MLSANMTNCKTSRPSKVEKNLDYSSQKLLSSKIKKSSNVLNKTDIHIDKTGNTKPIQQNYGKNSKPYIHGIKNYFVNDTQQNKIFKLDDSQKMPSLKKKGSCEVNIN